MCECYKSVASAISVRLLGTAGFAQLCEEIIKG